MIKLFVHALHSTLGPMYGFGNEAEHKSKSKNMQASCKQYNVYSILHGSVILKRNEMRLVSLETRGGKLLLHCYSNSKSLIEVYIIDILSTLYHRVI